MYHILPYIPLYIIYSVFCEQYTIYCYTVYKMYVLNVCFNVPVSYHILFIQYFANSIQYTVIQYTKYTF